MRKSIHKILLFIVETYPLLLSAQFCQLSPMNWDTLTFDTLKIPRLTYVWDGEFENYELIDPLKNSHIVEVLYGNNNVRGRSFIKTDSAQSSHIHYLEDGSLLYFSFGAYYRETLWWFSGNEHSLMFQAYPEEQQNLLAEFSKYTSRKNGTKTKPLKYWKLTPRHGRPVKYARKLLKIYKVQYKDVFYHLDNCIWY